MLMLLLESYDRASVRALDQKMHKGECYPSPSVSMAAGVVRRNWTVVGACLIWHIGAFTRRGRLAVVICKRPTHRLWLKCGEG